MSRRSTPTSRSTTRSSPASRAESSHRAERAPAAGPGQSPLVVGSGRGVVLGVDPGTRHTGFAVLTVRQGRLTCAGLGTVPLPARWTLARRLGRLGLEITSLIERYRPDHVSVEQAIYAQNVRTALALGQARGVVLYAAASCGAEVFEYSPREVKLSVAGNGRAAKRQVQGMVRRLLGLATEPAADAADAAALALCHLLRAPTEGLEDAAGADGASPRRRRGSAWTSADVEALRRRGLVP